MYGSTDSTHMPKELAVWQQPSFSCFDYVSGPMGKNPEMRVLAMCAKLFIKTSQTTNCLGCMQPLGSLYIASPNGLYFSKHYVHICLISCHFFLNAEQYTMPLLEMSTWTLNTKANTQSSYNQKLKQPKKTAMSNTCTYIHIYYAYCWSIYIMWKGYQ